jgi:hypothetical protein
VFFFFGNHGGGSNTIFEQSILLAEAIDIARADLSLFAMNLGIPDTDRHISCVSKRWLWLFSGHDLPMQDA